MKKIIDFIGQMSEEIAENGIMVLDDITHMPSYGEPYISPHYTIGLNHRGSVIAEYDGMAVSYSAGDISVVYPNHVLYTHSSSADYQATLVVVSGEMFSRLVRLNTGRTRFSSERLPHFHLTKSQYNDILVIIEALRTLLRIGNGDRDNATEMLYILTNVIDTFRAENETVSALHPTNFSSRFYEAVVEHSRRHHEVAFYADLFCLTPKYFSTLIKQETGSTAGHWIQQHLVAQAKILLRTQNNMRLNEVAEHLGFPDLAAFSRFFRRETGLSPSEYRK